MDKGQTGNHYYSRSLEGDPGRGDPIDCL
jgi:hypothetical protein